MNISRLRKNTMRRLFAALLLLTLMAVALPPRAASAQTGTSPTTALIAALNDWRIDQGLWPLKVNPTLEAMAVAQAEYLLTLPELPEGGAIHTDARGQDPRGRAPQPPYNWPTYGRTDQIAVGEIAYVGRQADALNFWLNVSALHRNTVANPAYREIGVAALRHPFGYLYIVVFGGRPDVLPALVDPVAGRLYLSNERFAGARSGTWIREADRIRLFDADGRPLSRDWQPWQLSLPVPPGVGDRMFIQYTDGTLTTLAEVHLDETIALLPDTLAAVSPASTTAAPAILPAATSAPAGSAVLPAATPVTAGAAATPVPASTPTQAPTAVTQPDILIAYDSRVLAIVNTSGRALNLTGLELHYSGSVLPAMRWQTQWLSAPLVAFPSGDCLQIWSWSETGTLPPPPQCRTPRSVINTAPDRLFWATGSFEIVWQGAVLATCEARAGQCVASLPGG